MINIRIKLFTHTDLDGIGCAILGKLAFKDNIDIEYCEYGNINNKVESFILNKEYKSYDLVYITDISINKEIAELINNVGNEKCLFRLLDHHSTALWLNEYDWARVEEEMTLLRPNSKESEVEKVSGTYLFFIELFFKNYLNLSHSEYIFIENFADIVRKYDTWLWKEKYNDVVPKQWNDLFYILGRDRFIEETINKIKANNLNFTYTDNLLLELKQYDIDRYVEKKNKEIIFKNILGYKAGIVFAEQYHSELGNRLCELNPDLDFLAIINPSRSVSYRAIKDDIDLGNDVAKIFGGGGHPKAAGSPISDEIRENIIKMLFGEKSNG